MNNNVKKSLSLITIILFSVQDKSAALRYISTCVSQSGVSNVQYLTDTTLPSGWKCQKMEDSIYYFSPRGER